MIPISTKHQALRLLTAAAIFLLLKYAGGLVLSLILLILTVSAINGGAEKISHRTGLPKKLCATALVIALTVAIGLPSAFILHNLAKECKELLTSLSENRAELLILADNLLHKLGELRYNIPSNGESLIGSLSEALSTAINKGAAYILSIAGRELARLVGKAPALLGGTAFMLISGVWLSIDLDGIKKETERILPPTLCDKLFTAIRKVHSASSKYLRAHILLFAMTLAETYIALVIMRLPYALAMSVAVATVDILPLLGAGVILLPLAGIALLFGYLPVALGLLITLTALWITRQLTEPYLVGRGLGVHPFFTFTATLTGLAVFGPTGAITLPLLLTFIPSGTEKSKAV